jgi:hypothetical protein
MSPEFLVAFGEIEKHIRWPVDDRHLGQSLAIAKFPFKTAAKQKCEDLIRFCCDVEDFSRKLKAKR